MIRYYIILAIILVVIVGTAPSLTSSTMSIPEPIAKTIALDCLLEQIACALMDIYYKNISFPDGITVKTFSQVESYFNPNEVGFTMKITIRPIQPDNKNKN